MFRSIFLPALMIVVGACSSPTEVWLPCDVAEPADYCSGTAAASVYVLPVDRYAVLIKLPTSTPQ